MKIKFDSNQKYQRDATDAILGLFDGPPPSSGAFEFALPDTGAGCPDGVGLALNVASM